MKQLLRKHIIIGAIAILVLIVALVALYLLATSMSTREKRVLDTRDRLASFEQNKRIFETEAEEFEVIRGRIESLEQNILTEASVPALLSSLEEMAKARNVDFELTGVQNTGPEAAAKYLHVDFSATGSFANLELLANDVLSQTYQARFSRFSLYLQETSTGGQVWQLLAGIDITSF